MIVYKIDKQPHHKTTTRIRDMKAILDEIPISLNVLLEVIDQHAYSISSPSIDNYRSELRETILNAIDFTRTIAQDSQKLSAVSDQAGKHLAAIEEHFGAVLRNKTAEPVPAPVQ